MASASFSATAPPTGAALGAAVKPSACSSASTWMRKGEGSTRMILASAPSTGSASRADQPEHDGDRLVVAQHQRGQAVAGPYPVAASHTALALDRDVERLQGRDVAPHRAGVDLQAPRDLPAGRE